MEADQAAHTEDPQLSRSATAVGIGSILAVVATIFVVPILSHDWAIGDGGLFYVMIGDIIAAGFALPDSTTYQHGVIPFAYPPLGFYLAAALEASSGLARADLLRFLPATFALSAVAAMFLLADEIGPTRRHALLSMGFFGALLGVSPAVTALIGGGGLTRSLGLLLAILATWQGLRMFRTGRWLDIALTSLLAGIAVASHPQAGVFLAVALGAGLLTRWRSLRNLVRLALAAAGALLVIAPWVATVVTRHGVDPFISASAVPDRDLVASLLAYGFLFLTVAPLVGVLDIVGQVQQAAARRAHLLVWRASVFVFDIRFSPVAAAAPASLLAAHGVLDAIVPLAWGLLGRGGREVNQARRQRWRRAIVMVSLTLAFLPSLWQALDARRPSAALSADQLAAMTWVRDNTTDATVTVSLATDDWGSDIVSEWFPALSERRIATAAQGLEWVAPIREAHQAAEDELSACQGVEDVAGCVDGWLERYLADEEVVVFIDAASDPRAGADLVEHHGYQLLWTSDTGLLLAPS